MVSVFLQLDIQIENFQSKLLAAISAFSDKTVCPQWRQYIHLFM